MTSAIERYNTEEFRPSAGRKDLRMGRFRSVPMPRAWLHWTMKDEKGLDEHMWEAGLSKHNVAYSVGIGQGRKNVLRSCELWFGLEGQIQTKE